MKKLLIILFACASCLGTYSQAPCSLWPRYDDEVFSTVQVTTEIIYGSSVDYQGVTKQLKMDIYEPAGDTLSKRPLIIFAHGGSFVAGDKTNSDQVNLCTHFAKCGYVTATINYRLGISFPIGAPTASDAVYRALQDMKAAIRYFRMDAATVDSFGIDTNIIVIGGTSAGAFTALHTAYMDTYSELPVSIDTAVLGDLEGNSGNAGYASNAHAVVNLCGALGSAQFVQPGDVPLCSMHGTNDQTVPYSTQMLYLFGLAPIMVVDGSYAIHDYLNTMNYPEAFYSWQGAGHVPYDGVDPSAVAYLDTTLRFVSNFIYSFMGCTPSDPEPLPNFFIPTGIESIKDEAFIIQNPVHGEIIFQTPSDVAVNLYDAEGKMLFSFNALKGRNVLPIPSLRAGFYLMHYKAVDKQGVLKVMVH